MHCASSQIPKWLLSECKKTQQSHWGVILGSIPLNLICEVLESDDRFFAARGNITARNIITLPSCVSLTDHVEKLLWRLRGDDVNARCSYLQRKGTALSSTLKGVIFCPLTPLLRHSRTLLEFFMCQMCKYGHRLLFCETEGFYSLEKTNFIVFSHAVSMM